MLRLCIILSALCLGLSGSAFAKSACPNPVFGVSAIKIDQTAETANEAQKQALAEMQKKAFQTVLHRLVSLSDGMAAEWQAEDYIELVHIRTETSLPGRYIAEIDICFSDLALRQLFQQNGWQWAEITSPPVLILPLYRDPAGIRAWQAGNEWLTSWREAAREHDGLIQFTELPPTLVNERQLRAETLFAEQEAILKLAAMRANAQQILLVRAIHDFVDGKALVMMNARLFDENGVFIGQIDDVTMPASSLTDYTAYNEFRSFILTQFEQKWHEANLRGAEMGNELTARILFANLEDWVSYQTALAGLESIETVEVLSLQINQAILRLKMTGSLEALSYGLLPLGLSLQDADADSAVTKLPVIKAIE